MVIDEAQELPVTTLISLINIYSIISCHERNTKTTQNKSFRRVLQGYNDFEKWVYRDNPRSHNVIQVPEEVGGEVDLEDLINKIFKQYYDEDGDLR